MRRIGDSRWNEAVAVTLADAATELEGYLMSSPTYETAPDFGEPPRRIRMDRWTPAERAIYDAIQVVEAAGADERLTDAVILLGRAKDRVADYVDGIVPGSYEAEERAVERGLEERAPEAVPGAREYATYWRNDAIEAAAKIAERYDANPHCVADIRALRSGPAASEERICPRCGIRDGKPEGDHGF